MRHWIWTIFNEIPLWIDKSDFMQEESPGFQLTGGSRCRSITKRERGGIEKRKKLKGSGGEKPLINTLIKHLLNLQFFWLYVVCTFACLSVCPQKLPFSQIPI